MTAMAVALLAPQAPSAQPAAECRRLASAEHCPIVYQVHKQSRPGPSLDLLVLGDGFAEAELRYYQCAVDKLVGHLLTTPPFDAYACSLNVYRLDLVTGRAASGIAVKPGCTDNACADSRPAVLDRWNCPPRPGTADTPPGGPACAILDLESQLCDDGKDCRYLGTTTTGKDRILALTTCLPHPDVVMVLARSGTKSGRAEVEYNPSYALATLALDDAGSWALQTHELGHALFGLLDEYEESCPPCGYRDMRNVVSGKELRGGVAFPWKQECPGGACGSFCAYTVHRGASSCPEGSRCPNDEQPCCPPPGSAALARSGGLFPSGVGLMEGAWYRKCGYYRAEGYCRMRANEPFCAGCRAAARVAAAGDGVQPCSVP